MHGFTHNSSSVAFFMDCGRQKRRLGQHTNTRAHTPCTNIPSDPPPPHLSCPNIPLISILCLFHSLRLLRCMQNNKQRSGWVITNYQSVALWDNTHKLAQHPRKDQGLFTSEHANIFFLKCIKQSTQTHEHTQMCIYNGIQKQKDDDDVILAQIRQKVN